MADDGSVRLTHILGALVAAAAIAASAVGSYLGANVILRDIDRSLGLGPDVPLTEQGPEDGVARTDKFVLVLPHPVERTTEQSVRPSGEVLMVTAWRPTNDDEAPAVSVYTYELPVPIADQEQLQLALAAEAHSIAASLGTINWEDACPVMGDAAACVSFNIFSVVGKVTTIGHGSTVVDIVTLGSSPENAARHELVVQTLAWLS